MEIEPSPPVIAKKLWNTVRIVFLMVRKGMSKSKLILDLQVVLKRGKLAGKALGELMLDHHAALSCRSDDIALNFVSPREYEFSCSNSPAYPTYLFGRKHHLPYRKYYNDRHHHLQRRRHQVDDCGVVQRVFEVLNKELPEASPLVLPGFGRSPAVRQLRVTDSPFPLKEAADEDTLVDKAAEEFIEKFYKELNHQKKMAALESPSPYHGWAR